jgi:methionyl-tRNA formyltransferase
MNKYAPKLLVFGIYQLGVSALEQLLEAGYSLQAVVTKPAGPGQVQPVMRWAEQHRIPCLSPTSPRDPAFIEEAKRIAPDLILIAGYHRIILPEVLAIPPLGTFNLHASLLPRYRGPCPYKWVLINGETETGLTVHRAIPELDSGAIYGQVVVPISEEDDSETLFLKLCEKGADLLCRTVEQILTGTCTPQPQDEALATYQSYPREEDCQIDWARPATEIRNLVRGLCPSPGAWTFMGGEKLRIWKATVSERRIEGSPGRILQVNEMLLATTATDNLILERWSEE